MMRSSLLVGLGLVGLILGGCSTLPPVSSSAKNVVVAEVAFNATNQANSVVNGVSKANITVKLLNWDTKENFTATSVDNTGLVTFTNLPPGTYSIRDITARVDYMTNTVYTGSFRPAGALFELVDGKVNNLGQIEWKQNKAEQTYAVSNHAAVQKDAKVAVLAGVNLEWAEVKLTTEE